MKFYCEEKEAVLTSLNSCVTGLSSSEAEKRIAENGKNKLAEPEKEGLFKKFLRSIADPMIIMLIVAAAIQAVVTVIEAHGTFHFSDFADVLVILVVVVINTAMSLIQESKSEAAMEALMQMTAATSKVMRDGRVCVIKSEDIAVGDVVVFEAGDAVPADCRIIESHSLKAEEAALTGESVPVSKIVDMLYWREGEPEKTCSIPDPPWSTAAGELLLRQREWTPKWARSQRHSVKPRKSRRRFRRRWRSFQNFLRSSCSGSVSSSLLSVLRSRCSVPEKASPGGCWAIQG